MSQFTTLDSNLFAQADAIADHRDPSEIEAMQSAIAAAQSEVLALIARSNRVHQLENVRFTAKRFRVTRWKLWRNWALRNDRT